MQNKNIATIERTVAEWNTKAFQMYEKNGFKILRKFEA